jgi:hypothetical protein
MGFCRARPLDNLGQKIDKIDKIDTSLLSIKDILARSVQQCERCPAQWAGSAVERGADSTAANFMRSRCTRRSALEIHLPLQKRTVNSLALLGQREIPVHWPSGTDTQCACAVPLQSL